MSLVNNKFYLKGNENERFAEILYVTLRIIMIKHISGKLNLLGDK